MIPFAHDANAARILRDLTPEFLERYNRVGPRYTSYPTAPEWSEVVTERHFREHARQSAAASAAAPLSLYVHIPFCVHRCRFCACNVIITRKTEIAEPYLQRLDQEMGILSAEMKAEGVPPRPVTQVHFGGGTPTYLAPAQFEWLLERMRAHFALRPDAELSLEADPCVTSPEHLRTLAALGFNRISFGVQDFHAPTQELIERVQTVEETEALTVLARELGFASVNYDLVYGLPLQTVDTFARTLDIVLQLRPDRLALYNFAYLPSKLGHQRELDPATLPSGPEKFRIFVLAYERFLDAGYEYIGMDHFAVPDDALARARRERTLQRNFMGYTTQAGTELYAFGVSAISTSDRVYVQNTKKLSRYGAALDDGRLPVERGMILSEDDRLRRAVISELMCHGRIVKAGHEQAFGIDFDDYFADALGELPSFVDNGLVVLYDDRIEVTLLGFIFVRNIAMLFDRYLRRPQPHATFSRTL